MAEQINHVIYEKLDLILEKLSTIDQRISLFDQRIESFNQRIDGIDEYLTRDSDECVHAWTYSIGLCPQKIFSRDTFKDHPTQKAPIRECSKCKMQEEEIIDEDSPDTKCGPVTVKVWTPRLSP